MHELLGVVQTLLISYTIERNPEVDPPSDLGVFCFLRLVPLPPLPPSPPSVQPCHHLRAQEDKGGTEQTWIDRF